MPALKGPWQVEQLKTFPRPPWEDDRLGAYVIAIKQSKYKPVHGPSRFIYIGAMGTTENASLRKRVGEFLVDAFGFLAHHSAGTRFYEKFTLFPLLYEAGRITGSDLEVIKQEALSPWDLEFWWYETDDPLCCEAMLMKAYKQDFQTLPRLNKKRNIVGCREHVNELENGEYEKGTRYPWQL